MAGLLWHISYLLSLLHSPPSPVPIASTSFQCPPQSSPPISPLAHLPRSPPFLFSLFLLTIIATSNTNNFFAYHAPGAVASSLQSTYHLDTSSFGLLFTLYSLPNIFLVFIGGLAIDRFGPTYTSLLFNLLMLLGMIIFALAPLDAPMPYFVVGRLLLGFGESLCASIATALGMWFKGSVLTFAVGFNQAYVQLMGSAAAFYLLPLLGSAQRAGWVTAAVCGVSVTANLVYVFIERSCIDYKPEYAELPPSPTLHAGEVEDGGGDESDLLVGTMQPPPLYDGRVDDERWKLQGHAHNIDDEDEIVHVHSLSPSSSSVTSTLTSLSPLYWLVILMILLLSPILYTFTAFGPLEFQDKYYLTPAQAGSATSVLYVTIIFSPLAGYVIDTVGYRTLIQFAAASLIPVWFALLTFTSLTPYLGMTLLGLTFAVTESNGYAMVVEVVPPHQLGVAYGIAGCGVSLALLLEPAGVGLLKGLTGSFFLSDLIFIGLAVAGWAVSGAILWYDVRHGSVMSGPKRRRGEDDASVNGDVDEDGGEGWGRGVVVAVEGIGQGSMRRTSFSHSYDLDGDVHVNNRTAPFPTL